MDKNTNRKIEGFAFYESFEDEPKGMIEFPLTKGEEFTETSCIVAGLVNDIFEVFQVCYINEFSIITDKGEMLELSSPLDTYLNFCICKNKMRVQKIDKNIVTGTLYSANNTSSEVITAKVIAYFRYNLYIVEINGHRDYYFLDFSTIDKESLQFQVAECKEELTDFAYTATCKPKDFPN